MKQLPKAIRDLQGDLWVPAETADLLERVLRDAREPGGREYLRCLGELETLLGFHARRDLPSAREQLALPDEEAERLAKNLLRI